MTDLTTLIEHARANVEAGKPHAADVYYQLIHRDTTPPQTGMDRVAHGEACAFFATKALKKGRTGEAGDWYREAIDADTACADYRVDMAMRVYLPIGMADSARVEATRATEIEAVLEQECREAGINYDPAPAARAWRALAGIEHETGKAEAARAASDRALELAPDDALCLLTAVALAIDTADYDRARGLLARLPASKKAEVLHCEAMILYRKGRHQEAIETYTRALEANPDDEPMVRWNRALPRHSIGDYPGGWEDYEARAKQKTVPLFATACTRFSLPIWRGEPPPARLHLHEEMGFGDTLALARYAPFLAEQGYDVRLEVRKELLSLFRHSFPEVKVIPKALDYPRGLRIEPFDYHCPLLSIPHAVGMTVDTVHWAGPYLTPDLALVEDWQRRLPQGRRIGVCWSSGIRDGLWLAEYGRRKSLSFEQLAPLFSTDAVFVSLQGGPPARENSILPGIGENPASWDETAALIACLDLVITVDSAVAHLAGAMGKPTWVMMHREGSFHFMADVEGMPWQHRSPWYPSVRLFRQETAHEWTNVVNRIVSALAV